MVKCAAVVARNKLASFGLDKMAIRSSNPLRKGGEIGFKRRILAKTFPFSSKGGVLRAYSQGSSEHLCPFCRPALRTIAELMK